MISAGKINVTSANANKDNRYLENIWELHTGGGAEQFPLGGGEKQPEPSLSHQHLAWKLLPLFQHPNAFQLITFIWESRGGNSSAEPGGFRGIILKVGRRLRATPATDSRSLTVCPRRVPPSAVLFLRGIYPQFPEKPPSTCAGDNPYI